MVIQVNGPSFLLLILGGLAASLARNNLNNQGLLAMVVILSVISFALVVLLTLWLSIVEFIKSKGAKEKNS